MSRYQPHEHQGVWAILDRFTGERVTQFGELTAQLASAVSELMNGLEAQQNWRVEAARWAR
jgi:hypothetical protein